VKALKRFTITVKYHWLDEEQTDVLVGTTDLATLMRIWDPFYGST
jgi:hypothetical protein